MVESTGKLNPKQLAFVMAYIGSCKFNATKAALEAGYSEKYASELGYQLLHHPTVAARVKQELSNRAMEADAVLSELADVATADWSDFLTIRRDHRSNEVIDVKMDLTAKMKALELIGKAHGIFTDRVDVSGTMTARVELVGIDEGDI